MFLVVGPQTLFRANQGVKSTTQPPPILTLWTKYPVHNMSFGEIDSSLAVVCHLLV